MTPPDLSEVDSLIKALWLSSELSPQKVIIQEKKGALISDAGLAGLDLGLPGGGRRGGGWGGIYPELVSDPSPAIPSWSRQVVRPFPSPMPASTPSQVL